MGTSSSAGVPALIQNTSQMWLQQTKLMCITIWHLKISSEDEWPSYSQLEDKMETRVKSRRQIGDLLMKEIQVPAYCRKGILQ